MIALADGQHMVAQRARQVSSLLVKRCACSRDRREAFRRACLVVLATVAFAVHAAAQSKRALADLGRLDPPAYAEPLVRSGEPSPVFDEAMTAYGRRQYERVADLLRRYVAAEPDDPAANFYLAVSLMMIDDVGEAEDRLGAVVAAGASPFLNAARFVMAKASIRMGHLDVADRELERLSREEGPFAREAALLQPRVRALGKRR